MDYNKEYESFLKLLKELYHLRSLEFLLSWDQETKMPVNGIFNRAEQMELLSEVKHSKISSNKYKNHLENLINFKTKNVKCKNFSKKQKAVLRESLRDFSIETKFSKSFVKEFAKISVTSTQAWQEAKKENNFSKFLPYLKKVVDLNIEKANILGYSDHPYDALINLYEPEMTTKKLNKIFKNIKIELTKFLKKIEKSKKIDDSFLKEKYSIEKQKKFVQTLLQSFKLDKKSYRLDESYHPFCVGISPGDIRFTTSYHQNQIMSAISSTIHESGHGMYEMDLPEQYFGTPLCEAASFGIHESQSRFWEVYLGKSLNFWKFFYPKLQKSFKEFKDISLDKFYRAINTVEPSFIRIEADEVTYPLHIILRFEIEKDLIAKKIDAADLPEIWNEKMQKSFGKIPPNDSLGCMQDIHWSSGYFGYFPTYSLGNIYAAQIFEKMQLDIKTFEKDLILGKFKNIKNWLLKNIHVFGRYYSPEELLKKATGQTLDESIYIKYLIKKYSKIYNF